MSDFSEKPILLVTDKFEFNQDGLDFIKSLSGKKISIISVIGPKASGKSFLSNQLIGIFKNGFEIGSIENRTECCTKGIWIWGKPQIFNDKYILILDAQGFQSENEEQIKFNQKLFILLNLISSIMIYNYKKDDESEENDISENVLKNSYELFMKLLPILDNAKLDKDNNNLSEENIPNYIWLYRDYSIKDFNKYKDIINSFEQTNDYYNSLFKNKINYSSLPAPMEENDMLINLYLDEEDDGKGGPFDDEFKKKILEFKSNIIGKCEPKSLDGNILDGTLLEALISNYTKSLNLNENIIVNGPLISLINAELDKIKNNTIEKLKNELNDKNSNINDLVEKIKNSYNILSKSLDIYGESKIQNNYIIENINIVIDLFGKELVENYINNNISEYNDIINKLISQKENPSTLLLKEINQKEDIKTIYNNFNDEIKKDFENFIFNSKYEFLSSFPLLKNYFEKNIFNHMNKYIDNIDTYLTSVIKEQQKSDELSKIVIGKNKEINDQKSQIEKMKSEIDELKKTLETKEKEYTNNRQIKKEEYEKLEEEKNSLKEEKDKIIKELEDKNGVLESEKKDLNEKNENLQKNLDEMTNLKNELDQKVNEFIEKEKRKPKPQMVNIKDEDLPKLVELFKEIESTTKEYNETIKLYTKNKSKMLYKQFMEEAKTNINGSCEGWVQELKKVTKEKTQTQDSIYIEEINKLKEEKNKLNEEMEKIKNERDEFKDKNKNLEDELKLMKDIKNDIDNYKKDKEQAFEKLQNNNDIYKKKNEELQKIKSEMEVSLSTFKIDSKVKEDELYSTLNVFKSMIEKNKKNYEQNFKKLPEDIKNEVIALNKKHKFIK